MVCSDERKEGRYPFDIRHRSIINYKTESRQDFENLKKQLTNKIKALLKKEERLLNLPDDDLVSPQEGLSQQELAVIAALAGETALPKSWVALYTLKDDVERAGFTSVAFGIGLRRLLEKGFVTTKEVEDRQGDKYPVAILSSSAWVWIEENEHLFTITKPIALTDIDEDDIPF